MKNSFVIRVTGEICFFFSVLSIFPIFRSWWLPLALFTAACFALGFLIVRCKSTALRLLLSLLPGLCFLLAPLHWLLIFPGFAWLYYILVMTQGNYAMPLEEYRRIYRFLLLISLFFVAADIANSTLYRGELISIPSLVYVFLFMFLGLYAMRRMQMGADMSAKWRLSNAVSTAGIPLLAVGASVMLFLIFRFTQPILTWLLTPVGKGILWLLDKLFPQGSDISDQLAEPNILKPETNTLPYEPEYGDFGNESYLGDADRIITSHLLIEKAATIGAFVVLGLLLLLALYLVIQYVKRNQPLPAEGESDLAYDEGERIDPESKKHAGKAPRMVGNARKLRRIYQTYLEYVQTKGLEIEKSDTSQEILERAKNIRGSEQAERLRQLYIAARYGDPKAVTGEQVREAQDCLEQIVEVK